MRKTVLIAAAFALALSVVLVLSACGAGTGGGSDEGTGGYGGYGGTTAPQDDAGTVPADEGTGVGVTDVTIGDFAFSPAAIEVKVGDTVTWTNNDSLPHTVTGDGGLASSELATGQTYSKTFDTAGEYAYACTIHPAMTGTVVVLAK